MQRLLWGGWARCGGSGRVANLPARPRSPIRGRRMASGGAGLRDSLLHGLRPLRRPSSRSATARASCSTGSPRPTRVRAHSDHRRRLRRGRSGRRWSSRAGSGSRSPRRRAASGSARSRSRCSARSSAGTPRPRRSCPRCSRSTRSRARRRRRVGRAPRRRATRSRASRGTRPRRFPTRRRPTSRSCSPTTACTRWRSPTGPRAQPAMDLTRELGWLRVRPGPRPASSAATTPARGCSTGARRSRAADLLGSASRALDLAVEYAKDRVQFGRPIGSFQAVKHRCADMLVDVEGMRSTVYWAAWCIGADDAEASVAASTAKIWCSDASKRVMARRCRCTAGSGSRGSTTCTSS